MSRKGRRTTDHDSSTRLYIAQIECCYGVDLDITLVALPGVEPRVQQLCLVSNSIPQEDGSYKGVLLARGRVNTAQNATFNANVRYLLTNALLRLMEDAAQHNSTPFVRPSTGV